MQDLRTKRHVVFSFHLHLVFIYILVYILALLLEMSKSLSRLVIGNFPRYLCQLLQNIDIFKKEFYVLISRP